MTLVLHMGLPKTGTTVLQRHVFPAVENVLTCLNSTRGEQGPLYPIMKEVERVGFAAPDQIVQFKKVVDQNADKPVLVSIENFTFPRKTDITGAPFAIRDLTEGYDTKIIIVIRNQLEWLESYYFYQQSKVLKKALLESPTDFVAREMALHDKGAFAITDYFDLYKSWADLFGERNVMMLPYKWMAKDQERFFAPIGNLLGRDIDPMIAAYANAPRELDRLTGYEFHVGLAMSKLNARSPLLYKLVKRIAASRINKRGSLSDKARFDFSTILPPIVMNRWRDQNRQLAEMMNLDLEDVGLNL